MNECKSCAIAQAKEKNIFVYEDELWTVNLLLNNNPPKLLLGWMVMQPKRHVDFLSELTFEEQKIFGILLSRCETVLKEVLGIDRVYICLFAEDRDFHLHVHIIPRRHELPENFIGPEIFRITSPDFELADQDKVENLRQKIEAKLMANNDLSL